MAWNAGLSLIDCESAGAIKRSINHLRIEANIQRAIFDRPGWGDQRRGQEMNVRSVDGRLTKLEGDFWMLIVKLLCDDAVEEVFQLGHRGLELIGVPRPIDNSETERAISSDRGIVEISPLRAEGGEEILLNIKADASGSLAPESGGTGCPDRAKTERWPDRSG